jgi:hypothetical protein
MTFLAMDKDILTLKLQEHKFIGVQLLNQPLTGRNMTAGRGGYGRIDC